jgi:hypothetical protein
MGKETVGAGVPAQRRRSIGFYLPRSTFPATRGQLVCEARRAQAPDEVVRLLRALPASPEVYPDLQSVSQRVSGQERLP